MGPRIPNLLVALLNCSFVVISLGCFGYGLYFLVLGHTLCHNLLASPLLLTAAFFLFVSLCGFIASFFHNSFFMYLYLCLMFLLLVFLLGFTIFVFVVTNETAGRAFSQRGFGEYRLGDYSNWLRKHVVDAGHWDLIKSCMAQGQLCAQMRGAADRRVSPLQSGCCMPPSRCGFKSENATYWVIPKNGPKSEDPDCRLWSNTQTEVCYECSACKAGVLRVVRKEWRVFGIIHLAIIVFLLLVYSAGCWAVHTNTRKSSKSRYTKSFF